MTTANPHDAGCAAGPRLSSVACPAGEKGTLMLPAQPQGSTSPRFIAVINSLKSQYFSHFLYGCFLTTQKSVSGSKQVLSKYWKYHLNSVKLLKKEITKGQRCEYHSQNSMSYKSTSSFQLILGTICKTLTVTDT